MKNKCISKKVQSIGLFLNKNASVIAVCMMVAVMMSSSVFASADAMWTTVVGQLQKWVLRLGGAVIFVGGVMIGMGWISDDPSRKTQGLQVLAGGGIVTAIASIALQFLA